MKVFLAWLRQQPEIPLFVAGVVVWSLAIGVWVNPNFHPVRHRGDINEVVEMGK